MLDRKLLAAIEAMIDARVQSAIPAAGGMINSAACLQTDRGPLFAKWRSDAPPGFFAAECEGLAALADAGARVPAVLGFADREVADDLSTPFLLLEYFEPAGLPTGRHDDALISMLRLVHAARAPDGRFGWPHPNWIGSLPQQNGSSESWEAFYRTERLLPQLALARSKYSGMLRRLSCVERAIEAASEAIRSIPFAASLLHGDLWAGNIIMSATGPVLIDPAAHYGNAETEVAFMELFGGLSGRVIRALRSGFIEGYEQRRPIHQLYPMLVHWNHFGEPYGEAAERLCCEILSRCGLSADA